LLFGFFVPKKKKSKKNGTSPTGKKAHGHECPTKSTQRGKKKKKKKKEKEKKEKKRRYIPVVEKNDTDQRNPTHEHAPPKADG